jgi:3-phenylpropionate/trans-cinnamate dioxygenase ferredoxin subunit
MRDFVEVAKADELPEGSATGVVVEGRALLVARIGGRYYAADDICPHMGAKLSEGTLEGTVVICPRHGSRFDLADGHVVRWTSLPGPVAAVAKVVKSPRPLKTYPVKVEGDSILVQL